MLKVVWRVQATKHWLTVCVWLFQIYVSNSARFSEQSYPFGYLKASSSLSAVNLFVMPYNYPVLLPLLGECVFVWVCVSVCVLCVCVCVGMCERVCFVSVCLCGYV